MRIIVQDKRENKLITTKDAIILAIDKEGKLTPHFPPTLDYWTAMRILQTTQLHVMEMFSRVPSTGEINQAAREEIYDDYNASASSLLMQFIPDKELRPDLTEQAILEMENKILDEHSE